MGICHELRSRRKGKVKLPLFYKGKRHEAYLSHVKVQITASRKDIYLVLVYGITDQPMMLATNKEIKSKDDVIKIAKLYFSRWRIEEYFQADPIKVKISFCYYRLAKGISGILSYAKEEHQAMVQDKTSCIFKTSRTLMNSVMKI